MAKGLGGGYAPVGALLLVGRKVVAALSAGSGAVVHGHTYQAHPIACAAALEVQRIIREEDLLANVQAMGERLNAGLAAKLGQHPHVGDIRGRGLFRAIEFVADRDTKRPFEAKRGVGASLKAAGLAHGIAVYPSSGTMDGVLGDHVIVAPPYNVIAAEVDEIVERVTAMVGTAMSTIN